MAVNNNNNTTSLNNNTVDSDSPIKQGNLVVRIDQDSDDNLQALFDSVLKPGDTSRPLQVPLRMRKLPDSFFHPPSSGSKSSSVSHSRANSTDSAFSSGSQTTLAINPAAPPQISSSAVARGLAISHSRAHSSPASLQQTYAGLGGGAGGANAGSQNNNATGAGNGTGTGTGSTTNPAGQPPVVNHMKQRSYDVVSAIQLQAELGDLPVGWEQARTPEGQIYYLNHITKTTQWEDPRTQIAQQQQAALAQQQSIQQTAATQAKDTTVDPLGPLPEGWEQAVTSSGEIYFINHINRTTSWFDPRISDYLQRASSLSTRSDLPPSITNWVNIRNLEKEREYLKQRQQEIQHQDLLTRQNQQTMGLDPFLSGITDHTRQESGDSGLSLSSNFPVTPDFLSNIDDGMDCLSESGNLDSLSGLDSADDLVPSLQLGDNICSEMLNDVQSLINSPSTKPDNLNWYKMNIS